jgi:hypothetical protein
MAAGDCYEHLQVEYAANGVVTVRLDDPDRRDVMAPPMTTSRASLMGALRSDRSVRAHPEPADEGRGGSAQAPRGRGRTAQSGLLCPVGDAPRKIAPEWGAGGCTVTFRGVEDFRSAQRAAVWRTCRGPS